MAHTTPRHFSAGVSASYVPSLLPLFVSFGIWTIIWTPYVRFYPVKQLAPQPVHQDSRNLNLRDALHVHFEFVANLEIYGHNSGKVYFNPENSGTYLIQLISGHTMFLAEKFNTCSYRGTKRLLNATNFIYHPTLRNIHELLTPTGSKRLCFFTRGCIWRYYWRSHCRHWEFWDWRDLD